eukprot:TRINITY_DN3276_c0_g1_i1.p1 TRINITY_DN3276_c0_g1~~TRINITY_DN3276_c0_g1_i1.p1  ORF type:complete len:305 (-),score=133.05 TRINITY_DN3276_c0_g1_i1:162-1076(-)
MSAVKTQFLKVKDGNEIAYQILNENGKKRPLVMIMGLTGVKENWGEFSRLLSKDRPVLIFDNRAIGESKPSSTSEESKWYDITLDSMAKDTASLIESQGWKEVDLLGWSMGGFILQNLVVSMMKKPSNYSFRVKRIVLCATSARTPEGSPLVSALLQIPQRKVNPSAGERVEVAKERLKLLTTIMRLNFSEEFVANHKSEIDNLAKENAKYRIPFRVVKQQLIATGGFDFRQDLHLLKDIPTLVLHGSGDRILLQEGSKELLKSIPNSTEAIIGDGKYGHYFFKEHDFVETVLNHLDSTPRSKL